MNPKTQPAHLPGCFYCEAPLSPRHEHDHFPIPVRDGGDDTVCACINCHDMKDRQPLNEWPVEVAVAAQAEVWGTAEKPHPMARIYFAKLLALMSDSIPSLAGER